MLHNKNKKLTHYEGGGVTLKKKKDQDRQTPRMMSKNTFCQPLCDVTLHTHMGTPSVWGSREGYRCIKTVQMCPAHFRSTPHFVWLTQNKGHKNNQH
jgi:hypothetical protein